MLDGACAECERLWQAYDYARQCQLIIERDAAMEIRLAALVRKATNRCEAARRAVEDHEATHRSRLIARGLSASPL